MQSPITGKEMKLEMEATKLPFRKEEFEVMYHYYVCEESGERFTDDVLDTLNLNQVYNLYREKYGIPFPDEIRSIREQYGVSASKMSLILGFGANQYRLYETGEIPSVANGRLILAIKEPEDFIKQVKLSEHYLNEGEVAKIVQKAERIIQRNNNNIWNYQLTMQITHGESPSAYSGYCKLDFARVAKIISYFGQAFEVNKTKLNKLLFYADFGHYKRTGRSLTGLEYRAIQYGPVPAEYDKLYMKLQEDGLIAVSQKVVKDYTAEIFKGVVPVEEADFNGEELSVLERVRSSLGHLSTSDLVHISHEEFAWTANEKDRSLINYQDHAFHLQHFH
ncbi:type II toxin-antitoxin system antitoxin SocA domain-containing protein [Rufibacter latericius]|uniref:DUF4065 domain-containing protein n=1 Tax=Rufibacter latericius TaxID=2487040 RepID=A0A3M9MEM5_9BACT|nr:type II toxin-antitoxin system antitoxin SocA domain-containing protein [Rufibacter latericius]RNI24032.1 DUF4065 domain-containing protein [Rufibacter latericius]